LARRVIQFPVRNAFAQQRSHDSLARDTQARDSQNQAHRIVKQVEDELARAAERQAFGGISELERARSYGVVVMPQPTRAIRLRKRIATLQAALGNFVSNLFNRRQPQ
jgi:hypothetical protein